MITWRLNLVLLCFTFDSHLGWLNALRRKQLQGLRGPLTTCWGSLMDPRAPRGWHHPSPSSDAFPPGHVPHLPPFHTQSTLSRLWRLPSVPDFWALISELRQHLQLIWNVSAANLNFLFVFFLSYLGDSMVWPGPAPLCGLFAPNKIVSLETPVCVYVCVCERERDTDFLKMISYSSWGSLFYKEENLWLKALWRRSPLLKNLVLNR